MPSAEAKSGLGVPAGMPTTTLTVAIGVSVLGITLPEAMTVSSGGWTTGTSNISPSMVRDLAAPPEPKVGVTLWPVAFSKAGIRVWIAVRMPPGATKVISLIG